MEIPSKRAKETLQKSTNRLKEVYFGTFHSSHSFRKLRNSEQICYFTISQVQAELDWGHSKSDITSSGHVIG